MKAVAGFLQTLQAQETAVSPVECLSEFGRRNGESRSQHHWRASLKFLPTDDDFPLSFNHLL